MRRVCLLAVFMFAGSFAHAQTNTCTYTFTFPEHSFQFCLTSVGTLAMLQSPIGINHLDTENPIEGWTWGLAGTVPRGGDVFFDGENLPAYGGSSLGTPIVTQPNGPGTLPIRFDWHDFPADVWEIVTAQPAQRSIVMKVGIPARGVWYIGDITRIITLRLDGKSVNKFRHLRSGSLVYVDKGEAFLMESPGNYVCFGPGELLSPFGSCTDPPFNGYGTLFANNAWTPRHTILSVTYKIF